jgi:hypothetical protein
MTVSKSEFTPQLCLGLLTTWMHFDQLRFAYSSGDGFFF